MKIAILGTRGIPSGYSGYEAFAEELGERLVARGHSVTVYAHRAMFQQRPRTYRGIRVVYLPALKGKNTSQFSHSLLATLHVAFSSNDVILFCNASNGAFGGILRVARKPCAINVDGLEWMRPKWGTAARRYFRFGARASSHFFDRVITDAEGMRDVYRTEFGADSACIAYGADLRYSERPELLEPFGLAPGGYYLIASRLVPDNNADLIISAFVRSGSRRKLAIAGGTVYRNPFEDEVRQLADDRVAFLGHIDNADTIAELHCNAYAYLHGHEFGGTNPALLKALACGNCVLALDTVFNREVLADGKYGLLYRKSANELSVLIDQVDEDEEVVNTYRHRSRDRIEERYTWEMITDQYENELRTLRDGPDGTSSASRLFSES